jgi:WD40 repeat protein
LEAEPACKTQVNQEKLVNLQKVFRKLIYLELFLLGLLAACQQPTALPQAKSPLASSYSTETVMPWLTQTPPPATSTLTSSPTMQSMATGTPEFEEGIIPVCSGEGKAVSPPDDFGIDGTLVYQLDYIQGLYTLGGKPLSRGQLPEDPDQEVVVYGFSTDGKWLAYALVHRGGYHGTWLETPYISLLSSSGEHIEQPVDINTLEKGLAECCTYPLSGGVWDGYWINNNLLYTEIQTIFEEGGIVFSVPAIYDPFKNEWQFDWFRDLPDHYEVMGSRIKNHEVGFSPDLSRVLYPAYLTGLHLRDLTLGTNVWSDRSFLNYSAEFIHWSPDSKFVAAANLPLEPKDRRLLLISRDGEVNQIADATYPSPELFIDDISWSPNGHYLAVMDTHDIPTLYLFDLESDSYVYRCPLPGINSPVVRSIWSSDNAWIAFSPKTPSPLFILNVQTGEVIKLLEEGAVAGWSDKPSVNWP